MTGPHPSVASVPACGVPLPPWGLKASASEPLDKRLRTPSAPTPYLPTATAAVRLVRRVWQPNGFSSAA